MTTTKPATRCRHPKRARIALFWVAAARATEYCRRCGALKMPHVSGMLRWVLPTRSRAAAPRAKGRR